MKSKRTMSGNNWSFDGRILTVHIPMEWNRRGGRKLIIASGGSDAWAPPKPRSDETLFRALGRAHRWNRLLEDGVYGSPLEIAQAKKLTRSFVNRLLRLTLLAPDIQEAILEGWQPKGKQLEEFMRVVPSEWGEQRVAFASPDNCGVSLSGSVSGCPGSL